MAYEWWATEGAGRVRVGSGGRWSLEEENLLDLASSSSLLGYPEGYERKTLTTPDIRIHPGSYERITLETRWVLGSPGRCTRIPLITAGMNPNVESCERATQPNPQEPGPGSDRCVSPDR